MGFKEFLRENEDMFNAIKNALAEMSEEEIDMFGSYLADEFFDDMGEEYSDELYSIDDVMEMITILGPDMYDEILFELSFDEDEEMEDDEDYEEEEMDESINHITVYGELKKLGSKYKKAMKYMDDNQKSMNDITLAKIIMDIDSKEGTAFVKKYFNKMDEAVSRRLSISNYNRQKRKFMKTSKAELRRTKAQRKIAARVTKAKRKRYYKANKQKISSYQKSRAEAIKKGKHIVKLRKRSG